MAKAKFSDAPWEAPGPELSASEYCSVCLIDENPEGQRKVKDKCKLPIRQRPGGPINRNALRAAAAALAGARGGVRASPQAKQKAAQRLYRLFLQAGITPGEYLRRMVK